MMIKTTGTVIKKVKFWRENLDLSRPYTISYQTIDSVENIFVYLETDNGLNGIGSGSPADFITGETMDDSETALSDSLESLLLGEDIRMLTRHCRELEKLMPAAPAARMAADIALHDILAKYMNIPLVDMLGRVHTAIPTSKTIGIKASVQETLEEADEHLNTGFRIIKLKIGKDVDRDIEYTARLRERVGRDIGIRVDANQGYSPDELEKYVRETQKSNIEFIEQPLHKSKLEQMYDLPEDIRNMCAADENLHSPSDALDLSGLPHPFGIYNIKLMKCGGIFPASRIAGIADLADIDLMWGCMDESIVSITAGLHIAFASPATRYLDLDGSFDLAKDVVSGGFILRDGLMTITNEPGLGVKLLK